LTKRLNNTIIVSGGKMSSVSSERVIQKFGILLEIAKREVADFIDFFCISAYQE
jgi:hypothetical protein